MKIILMGYMASGKSLIGKKLGQILNYKFIDLDDYIEKGEGLRIDEIFKSKGEIYFRKIEHKTLKQILSIDQKSVISLGGGTPCYSNNLSLLLNNSNQKTFYLKVPISIITERLINEKKKRPLVAHIESKDKLIEFIGNHLFERLTYYSKAEFTIDANSSEDNIIESILMQLI